MQWPRIHALKTLLIVEISLAIIGILAPLSLFWVDFIFIHYSLYRYPGVAWVLHSPTLLIGFLSGMEIPLLVLWAKRSCTSLSVLTILAADYLGAFAGSLFFPLYVYEELGIMGGLASTSMINAVIAFYLSCHSPDSRKLKSVILASLFLISFMMAHEETCRRWFGKIYTGLMHIDHG